MNLTVTHHQTYWCFFVIPHGDIHSASGRMHALTRCFVTILSLLCHCSVTALSLFNGHFTASQSGQWCLFSSKSCQPEVSQLGGALTHNIQQLSGGLLEERGGEGKGKRSSEREHSVQFMCVYTYVCVYVISVCTYIRIVGD